MGQRDTEHFGDRDQAGARPLPHGSSLGAGDRRARRPFPCRVAQQTLPVAVTLKITCGLCPPLPSETRPGAPLRAAFLLSSQEPQQGARWGESRCGWWLQPQAPGPRTHGEDAGGIELSSARPAWTWLEGVEPALLPGPLCCHQPEGGRGLRQKCPPGLWGSSDCADWSLRWRTDYDFQENDYKC